MVDVSRVQKELTECNRGREVSGVSIALRDGASICHLTGTIAGPKDTPYEGGTFVIDIRLPSNPPPPFLLPRRISIRDRSRWIAAMRSPSD
jgi:ubiquitin-conjugating enzyme (huntingtin interacting protein 2)